MVKRMNITIPDTLHDRLSSVKDNLNVSRVCQEAIERAVGIEESKREALKEREKMIARLKGQKLAVGEKAYDLGKKAGYSLANSENISYEDLIGLSNHIRIDQSEFRGSEIDFFNYFGLPESIKEEVDSRMIDSGIADEEKYLEGIADGLLEIWREIENEV